MKLKVQIIPISDADPTLLGFCSFNIDDNFQVGDVGLHFKNDKYYLLFPTKRLRTGFIHYFRPLSEHANREMLQAAVATYRRAVIERDCEGECGIRQAKSKS